MKIKREQLKIDPKKCDACHKCTEACAMKHHSVADPEFSRIKILRFENQDLNVPVICMACENPICTSVCPMNARQKKENGTIVTSPETCIGCKACLYICPVGSPSQNPLTSQTMTCDMCEGDPGGPQCVHACRDKGAITISEIDTQICQRARLHAGRMRRVFV